MAPYSSRTSSFLNVLVETIRRRSKVLQNLTQGAPFGYARDICRQRRRSCVAYNCSHEIQDIAWWDAGCVARISSSLWTKAKMVHKMPWNHFLSMRPNFCLIKVETSISSKHDTFVSILNQSIPHVPFPLQWDIIKFQHFIEAKPFPIK